MKKSKNFKRVIAASLGLIILSTAASVSGTVAWFTASQVVKATGMSIKADTETGLVIANEAFTNPTGTTSPWNDFTEATHDGTISGEQAAFIPTSTVNATTWYHANASQQDNHAASEAGYTELTLGVNGSGTGVYKVTNEISVKDKNVYLLNTFHLKSSTPSAVKADHLYVNEVVATGSTSSVDLDKSLRVLVKYESNIQWFAPFETGTELVSYTVGGVASQTYTPVGQGVKNTILANNVTIPASTTANADTLPVDVFIYFEGEDANCKSSNIVAELDTLALEIKLGTETIL